MDLSSSLGGLTYYMISAGAHTRGEVLAPPYSALCLNYTDPHMKCYSPNSQLYHLSGHIIDMHFYGVNYDWRVITIVGNFTRKNLGLEATPIQPHPLKSHYIIARACAKYGHVNS